MLKSLVVAALVSISLALPLMAREPLDIASAKALASEYTKWTGNPTPPLSLVQENADIFQQAIKRAQEEKSGRATVEGYEAWKATRQHYSATSPTSARLSEWLRDPANAVTGPTPPDHFMEWLAISAGALLAVIGFLYRKRLKRAPKRAVVLLLIIAYKAARWLRAGACDVVSQARQGVEPSPTRTKRPPG